MALLEQARASLTKVDEVIVPPRDAKGFGPGRRAFLPHHQH